jgi:hypothetical protein
MRSSTRVGLLILVLGFLGCQRDTLAPGSDVVSRPPSFAKPGPPPPPADPAIAFVQNAALMVMNADGSIQTQVLNAGETSYEPSWSPDGTQIVFGSSIQGSGVYVVNVDGTNLRKVVGTTSGGPANPVWSPVPAPDGSFKIGYLDLPGPPDGTIEGYNNDLFLVNPDGTGRVNLTNTRDLHEGGTTWSPSARRLAADVQKFTAAEPGVHIGVFVYDLGLAAGSVAITGQTNVTTSGPLSSAYRVFRAAWAKTGDRIAVAVFETGSSLRDIWWIDLADPANPVNLTQTPTVSENMPSWSPDDLRIAFQRRNSRNKLSIFVMNTDGSGVTEIGKPAGQAAQSSPDWRRNP